MTTETIAVGDRSITRTTPTNKVGAMTISTPYPADLFIALADAAAGMGKVVKHKSAEAGTRGAYEYADLASALDACRLALGEQGVTPVQAFETYDAPYFDNDGNEKLGDKIRVTTMLIHASGFLSMTTEGWPGQQKGVQGIGSTITYLRRYSLLAMVGLAPEDDDGKASTDGQHDRRARPQGPPAALSDQWLSHQCDDASSRGWTDSEILGCLTWHGSQRGVAGVPRDARLACWKALGGQPAVNPELDPMLPQDEPQEQQWETAFGDDAMRQACGKAMRNGWSQEQVASCLRNHGSPEAKVAHLPDERRQACWHQLQDEPPKAEPTNEDDFAKAEHPLDLLTEAIAKAVQAERWALADVAVLVTWGVGRMTKKKAPTQLDEVPPAIAKALVDTLSASFADWHKAVNHDGLDDRVADMTTEQIVAILGEAAIPEGC